MVLTLHIRHLTGESLCLSWFCPLEGQGIQSYTSGHCDQFSLESAEEINVAVVQCEEHFFKLKIIFCFVFLITVSLTLLPGPPHFSTHPVPCHLSLFRKTHRQINTERTKKHEKHVYRCTILTSEIRFHIFICKMKLAAFLLSHKSQVNCFLHR